MLDGLKRFSAFHELKNRREGERKLQQLLPGRLLQIEVVWLSLSIAAFILVTVLLKIGFDFSRKDIHILFKILIWTVIVAIGNKVVSINIFSSKNYRLVHRIRKAKRPFSYDYFLENLSKEKFAVYLRVFRLEENFYLYGSEFNNSMFLGPKFERTLIRFTGNRFPIVELVNPLIAHPLTGIVRVEIGERNWQTCIEELIQKSYCVFLFVNSLTDNITFELDLALKIASHKTIVFGPEYQRTPFFPDYHKNDFRIEIKNEIKRRNPDVPFISVPYMASGGMIDTSWKWFAISVVLSFVFILITKKMALFEESFRFWKWFIVISINVFFVVEIAYEWARYLVSFGKFRHRFREVLKTINP